jgi:hypothetical protein
MSCVASRESLSPLSLLKILWIHIIPHLRIQKFQARYEAFCVSLNVEGKIRPRPHSPAGDLTQVAISVTAPAFVLLLAKLFQRFLSELDIVKKFHGYQFYFIERHKNNVKRKK